MRTHRIQTVAIMNISNIPDFSQGVAKQAEPNNVKQATSPEAVPLMGQEAKLTVKEVLEVVQRANEALSGNQSNLKFLVDSDNGQPIVQIVDKETQEVLRQIPSVEMLKIAKSIEKMQGVLLSKEV